MDRSIEQMDLDPPPQPGLGRWVLPAVLVQFPLLLALVWGVDWRKDTAERPTAATAAPAAAPAAAAPKAPAAPTAIAQAPAAAPAQTACPIRPLLAAADGGKDGQFFPPADVAGKTAADAAAMLVVGKESAASGQRRDAEVAYLTACRIADAVRGPGSVESAEARYRLGRHYAMVAQEPNAPVAERSGLLKRAEAFHRDSLQSYTARLGESHEKTRFAAEGLQGVRQQFAQMTAAAGPAAPSAPAVPPAAQAMGNAAASSPAPAPATRPAAAPAPSARTVQPSFSCAKARSVPEKLICGDPELAQMDRDLSRLYAQAKSATRDPAAFKRQNDAQWRAREANCRDRQCLRQWYAQRRQQLMQSLQHARARP